MKSQAGWTLGILAIGIAAIVAVKLLLFPGIAFDQTQWMAKLPTSKYRTVRQPMADRLIAKGTLIGMTHAELLAMLGEPVTDHEYSAIWDAVYELGLERNGDFSLDFEYLVITLDSDGRVSDCTIAID